MHDVIVKMHEHFRGFTVRQYARNVHVRAVDPYYLILLATFYPFIFAYLDFDMPFSINMKIKIYIFSYYL